MNQENTYAMCSIHESISSRPNFLLFVLCQQMEDKEETALLRQKIIEIRQGWHCKNEEEIAKRWNYEEGVCIMSGSVLSSKCH
jgi:hypothetical protein